MEKYIHNILTQLYILFGATRHQITKDILHNEGIIDTMLEASAIRSSDAVFEVGPGTGVMTMKLLVLARKLYAIDIEPAMLHEVESRAEGLGLIGGEHMKKHNMKSYILESAIHRNEEVDRPEKDWNSNKGRAVV